MSTLKKRQHYIWRNYLRAWSKNDTIWTYFISQDKILQAGLMKVGQEKFYYELVYMTEEEEILLREFLEKFGNESLNGITSTFIDAFSIHSKFTRLLSSKDLSESRKTEIKNSSRKIEVNIMEDSHSLFENLGHTIINCRNLEDLKELEKEDSFFDAMIFIAFQYIRTKNMKTNALDSIKSERFPLIKFWNIISFTFAMNLAKILSLQDFKIILLKNQSLMPFITGDQPVFNVKGDDLDSNGNVKELELYYPISPETALLIKRDSSITEKYTTKDLTIDEANKYNLKVKEVSEQYIFSNKEDELKRIKNCP